jgi:hypothetical protein
MICAFAGLSLTYGWNLFRAAVLTEQSAELAARGWRLNLRRVGPGVFFALFGCIILSISLRSPLALPLTASAQNPASTTGSENAKSLANDRPEVIYLEGKDAEIAKRWVADLNTILHVATPEKFGNATEKKVILRTEQDLETLRNALVIKQFGAPTFRDYNLYRKRIRDEGIQSSPEEQEKFGQIDEWMQGNRIQE